MSPSFGQVSTNKGAKHLYLAKDGVIIIIIIIIHIVVFFVRLVGDNIDYEIHARVQSQKHRNHSIHWTHQFAVLDRVQDPKLDNHHSQKPVSEIQFSELLPDKDVMVKLVRNWAVIVSRVITKYLPEFCSFRNVVVRHIPHEYSKEMSQKSNSVSERFFFLSLLCDIHTHPKVGQIWKFQGCGGL